MEWSIKTLDKGHFILWDEDSYLALLWWSKVSDLLVGQSLLLPLTDPCLYTISSSGDWGALALHRSMSGT